MSGGPISGSGNKLFQGLIVPTLLQMSTDMLSYWSSMTCLYDRYWTGQQEEKVTFPIAMFHVKKITTNISKETTKKRVILLEPDKKNLEVKNLRDGMRESVMQVVVDNIVRNPKQYNIEAIVPFQPVGNYVKTGLRNFTDLMMAFTEISSGEGDSLQFQDITFSLLSASMKYIQATVDIAKKVPFANMDGASYINMNSLEAMADSERILCMKMWIGYDYKFGLPALSCY